MLVYVDAGAAIRIFVETDGIFISNVNAVVLAHAQIQLAPEIRMIKLEQAVMALEPS
jgi:hypothetical protein